MIVRCPGCGLNRTEEVEPKTYADRHCSETCQELIRGEPEDEAEEWEARVEGPDEETREQMLRRLEVNALRRSLKKPIT